jgi:hypothetical protein
MVDFYGVVFSYISFASIAELSETHQTYAQQRVAPLDGNRRLKGNCDNVKAFIAPFYLNENWFFNRVHS